MNGIVYALCSIHGQIAVKQRQMQMQMQMQQRQMQQGCCTIS